MPVIALGGIKHSGKSTVGRILSTERNIPFHDLDDLIRTTLPPKWTIRKWYREKGRQAFMDSEAESLRGYMDAAAPEDMRLLGLGGGSLENPDALKILKNEKACIIILDEEEDVLYHRIMRNGIPPFLDPDSPEESFHDLYTRRRRTLLEQGDHIINIHGLERQETAAAVDRVIRSLYGG
jgi:shikimate kinase